MSSWLPLHPRIFWAVEAGLAQLSWSGPDLLGGGGWPGTAELEWPLRNPVGTL